MSDEQPDATWSYQAGEWFGIVGPEITVLLPGSEKQRVTGLWELVDDGAGFDQVLDGLLSSGLSALPGFALIGMGPGPTRVLLRGGSVRAAVVAGDGPVALEGSTAATWAERVFEGVTSLTVSVGEPADQARHLPIEQGLVRVARIDRPEHAAGAAPPPAPPVVVPHVLDESSPLDDDADTNAQPSPYADLGAVPVEISEPEPLTMAFDPFDADPVADEEEAAEEEATGEPPPPLQSVGSWTSDAEPPTLPPNVPPPPPTLPPPPPPPPIAPAPYDPDPVDSDHDGMTRAGLAPGELDRQQPGIPGQPQPPGVTRPVAKLLVSNGETVDVDRVVLIGRAPEARRFASTEQPRLITVPSPLHEISSTHVEVRPGSGADHGSAVVTDMGSTNGTVLVQPGLGPEELKPGIAVQLIPGSVINLGDGVTIQVARP
ncbi:MAG: FHA domain-containing protein [Actinomycetota bacterium]|nr:FHA domain-containing protein [Actinomycetota bacterium]